MIILDELINSKLPTNIINIILFYSHPRMDSDLQNSIIKYKKKKKSLAPYIGPNSEINIHCINFNILRIFSGMQGFPVV